MKLLTKNEDYAIRALVVVANCKSGFISAKNISESQNIPYQFLRRILQRLIKERIIISREGGAGGVRLKKDPADICVGDVLRIFRGDLQLSKCMFRKKFCANRSSCFLRKHILAIENKIEKEFDRITIKKLASSRGGIV